jgi:MFS family permease
MTPRRLMERAHPIPSITAENSHPMNTQTNYRWYVMTLAALTHTLTMAMPTMCLPVLFKEISADLHLSLVQVGVIWGIGALPGILTSLAGGAIGDRFGARRTLIVGCLLAGLAGALRGLANSFFTFGLTAFLFGMVTPAITMSVHKTCAIWFSKQQLGLANGIASMGMALGFTAGSAVSATLLSPWLGGWRNVFVFYGAISVAMSIPWFLSRPAPGNVRPSAHASNAHPLETFRQIARIKTVWLLGLTILGVGSGIQGMLGYLPLYLRGLGWAEASADGALATFHAASMICVIPLALLSDRLGSRRRVLLAAALMVVLGIGLLSFASGSLVWIAVITAGFVRDGFMAIFMTMIMETDGVGPVYAGTAMGMVTTFSGLGNLIAPPLGNSLAHVAPSLPFAFWAGLAILGVLGLYQTREKRTASHEA